jgi:hypothetical protein
MNCYGCKFALEARNQPRTGEQVRCAKAEELFGTKNIKGGERWVDVRRSEKTGKLLKSKCGTYEPFQGDSEVTEEEDPVEKILTTCYECNGTGQKKISFLNGYQFMECWDCKGFGHC